MRTPYTFEDLMKKDHYRSIIFLTMIFGKEKGLTPEDYRYVLIKDHDGINKTDIVNKWKNKFKKNKNLRLIFILLIRIGSVTSQTNLSNFLYKLVNTYKILKKDKEKEEQIPYYQIKKDCYYKPWKSYFKKVIDMIPDKYIYDITNDFLKSYHSKLVADKVNDEDILKLLNY